MNAPRATPITDLDLSAWLDGELPSERHAEVESWLQGHPEDAARLRLWAADRDLLRAQLAGALEEPVPEALAQVLQDDRSAVRRPGDWRRLAAGVALFALGGLAGGVGVWQMRSQAGTVAAAEPAWVERAAVAHAVYVPEVRHPVEVQAKEEAHLAGWLTKRLDMPVKVFDLRAQGFELVGGRLLPDAAGPSAQLMYQSTTATPPVRVTVYVRRPEEGTPAAFRFERQSDLGLFYWVEGASGKRPACGYALVGALPREQLLALAEAIYQQDTVAGR